jgi:hypothetical protein
MTIFVGPKVVSATGGIVTNIAGYIVHTFTSSGIFIPNGTGSVEVLVVGGGGGGASPSFGGGGGGGGAALLTKFLPVLSNVSYPVTVGPGGNGILAQGNSSIFSYNGGTITAFGGGGAGPTSSPGNGGSSPNASGGGGFGAPGVRAIGGTGANVIGLGFPGGSTSAASSFICGGGGGGGGVGGGAVAPDTGGNGGPGVPYSITGIATFYGGGGGGGGSFIQTMGQLHPTSFPTMFGLGATPPAGVFGVIGNIGVVIVRYIS